MAAFSTALLALSGLASLGQGVAGYAASQRNARATRKQGWFEAEQLGRNAAFAEEQASDALKRGAEAEQRSRGETAQLRGTQRASLAASGVDITSGSAAELQGDTTELGELDALMIRNNAAREARGYKFEADEYRRGAQLTLRAAKAQATGYRQQGWTTLLGGAVGAAQSFGRMRVPRRAPSAGGYVSGTVTDI